MKVHSNHFGQPSKKRFIALSCATALASFALFAKPVFAEENTNISSLPDDNTISASTESIQTTADLVETREVNASQESVLAPSSEQAQTATSETSSQTNTSSENQASQTGSEESTQPEASADTSAFRSATTTADTEPATATADTVAGGHYYSDELGNWYYKDANGNNVTGEQTIDGQQVYFDKYGRQVKGTFGDNKHYYDTNSGALITNSYVNNLGGVYYVDQNGDPLKGAQTIDGKQFYFRDYDGLQVRGEFASDGRYYDKNTGELVTNSFVYRPKYYLNDTLYAYYVDENGIRLKGEQTINGKNVYFDSYDGSQIRNGFADNGHFYDKDGNLVDLGKNQYIYFNGYWRYVDNDGKILKGEQTIDGVQVYFYNYDGKQAKGEFAPNDRYYDKDTGALVTNRYIQLTKNETYGPNQTFLETHWYYIGAYGKAVKGAQTINGQQVYFGDKGKQVKGDFAPDGHYYDKDSGALVKNSFVVVNHSSYSYIYYVDDKGYKVKGEQIIDGKELNFGQYGIQVKGNFAPNGRFYDAETGEAVTNRYVQINTLQDKDKWFYIGADSKPVKGEQFIDGLTVYFDKDGVQVKGAFADDGYYYTESSGGRLYLGQNQFIQMDGNWYYLDYDGKIVKGQQTINGQQLFFGEDGKQIKGDFAKNGVFYDEHTGERVSNRFIYHDNNWYRIGEDGISLKGAQVVDGAKVYFDSDGKQVKGAFGQDGYYYDKHSGNRVDLGQNHYLNIDDDWYYIGNDGKILTGEQTIDGVEVYFDNNGKQVKGDFAPNNRFYDKNTGALLKDQFVTVKGYTYYVDKDGRKLTQGGTHTINGKEYTFVYYDAHLAKGEFLYPYGYTSFYDLNNKEVKGPQFVTSKGGIKYYLTASGRTPTGLQVIGGELYYFGSPTNKYANGALTGYGLTKDFYPGLIPYSSNLYYFDEENDFAIKNQYKEVAGSWYYFGPYWYALTGPQTIDGVQVYFHKDGKQAKGELINYHDNFFYYDEHTGALVTNQTRTINGQTYHFDEDGRGTIVD